MAEQMYRPEYHRFERMWYLWNGHDAVRDDTGVIRFFMTAADAYAWLTAEARGDDG